MAEYALVLAFVLGALIAIRGYFQTRLSGSVTGAVDNYVDNLDFYGGAYAPTQDTSSDSTFASTYEGAGTVDSDSTSTSDSTTTTTF